MIRSTFLHVIIVLSAGGFTASAVAADELDREIAQVKKEIERVNAQRKEENALAKKEQKEFTAYRERTARKKENLVHLADSMRTEIGRISTVNDSLARRLQSVERQIHEQDLQQEYLRNAVVKAVAEVGSMVDRLPPLIATQYGPPLEYLTSELKTKAVESTEALFRLMRVVQDVRTLSQEIQVVEGTSPVAEMHGSVYRLRIGAFFEAVVNQAGTEAYLWCGDKEDGEKSFQKMDDPTVAASVLRAIMIREGKSIPELVDLPLAVPCAEEVAQ